MKILYTLAIAAAALSLTACGGGGSGGSDDSPAAVVAASSQPQIKPQIFGVPPRVLMMRQVGDFCAAHGGDFGSTELRWTDAAWPDTIPQADADQYTVLQGHCVDQTEYLMAFVNATGTRAQ